MKVSKYEKYGHTQKQRNERKIQTSAESNAVVTIMFITFSVNKHRGIALITTTIDEQWNNTKMMRNFYSPFIFCATLFFLSFIPSLTLHSLYFCHDTLDCFLLQYREY